MRSILNEGVVVNVNSLSNGEAIEIVSTASTQSTANLNMKMNTTEQTAANTTDLMLFSDNATGKIVKYMTFANLLSSISTSTLLLAGKGIDIFSTEAGQSSINIGMLENTTEQTNVNSNDWLLVSDNSTGKIIKRVLFSTLNGSITRYWIKEDSTTVFLNDFNTDNVVIGDYQMSGSERFRVVGNSLFNGDIETDNTTIDNGGYLQFNELNSNGSNYIRLKGQDSLASNRTLNLPDKTGTIAIEYTGTSPISVNNTTDTISLTTVPVDKGGTGQTSYTDGQLLIGNTSGNTLTKATLTAGTNISITNGNGSITINANDYTGTSPISVNNSTDTISLTTVPVNLGGTNQTSYTDGQLLIGNTSGNTLTKSTLTAGTGISITNGNGSITLASTLTSSNWTLDTGSLYPLSASTNVVIGSTTPTSLYKLRVDGNVFFNGTLNLNTALSVDNGGTGQTSYTNGQLLIGNTTGNTLTKSTLTAGSGISITNGNGSITIANTSSGQWTYDSGNNLIYPNSSSTKVAIGNNAITAGFELENNGDFYNTGNITTGSLTSGVVVLQDPTDSGIRFDIENSGSYTAGRFIKPLNISNVGYIQIDYPFITGTTGTANRIAIQDENLSHYTYIKTTDISSDVNLTLPATTGTLARTQDIYFEESSNVIAPKLTTYGLAIGGTTLATLSDLLSVYGDASIEGEFNVDNDSVHQSSAVPTNGQVCLDVITPQGTTANDNVYVSKARYNGAGNTGSSNFTNWVYNMSSQSREFYGFSYWSGSGAGADIYSLEKDGDLNIAGTLSSSDSRIKTNIVDANLDECIDVLKSIKLKKYNYTDDYIATYNKTTQQVFGFLADDIMDNQYISYCGKTAGMPKKLNNEDGTLSRTIDDFKTIKKPEILSVLWGVCMAQQNRIETLEDEIESIKILLENNNII